MIISIVHCCGVLFTYSVQTSQTFYFFESLSNVQCEHWAFWFIFIQSSAISKDVCTVILYLRVTENIESFDGETSSCVILSLNLIRDESTKCLQISNILKWKMAIYTIVRSVSVLVECVLHPTTQCITYCIIFSRRRFMRLYAFNSLLNMKIWHENLLRFNSMDWPSLEAVCLWCVVVVLLLLLPLLLLLVLVCKCVCIVQTGKWTDEHCCNLALEGK